MIKAETIIIQLQNALAGQTTLFSDANKSITSLSRVDTTITAVTAVNHGLATNNYAFIKDAKSPIAIASIVRVGTIATVVTATDHDFTENFDQTTEIVGADQSGYNGTQTIVTVPNRRTFTFTVAGSPVTPATGTMFALNILNTGYNGRHQITKVNDTTFTYQITQTPISPAQGSPVMTSNLRMSGAVTVQKAIDAYTKMSTNELWGFVVLGDVFTSKDRKTTTDATSVFSSGDDFRQTIICPFSIFVIAPATDDIAGRVQRDQMEDVAVALFSSVLGAKLTSVLSVGAQYLTTFNGHRFVAFANAYYVHEFQFETVTQLNSCDIVAPDFNVAFRDISLDWLNPNETDGDDSIMEAEVDLDDVPL